MNLFKKILTGLGVLVCSSPVWGVNNLRVNPPVTEVAQGILFPQTYVVTSDSLIKKVVFTIDLGENVGGHPQIFLPASSLPANWTAAMVTHTGKRTYTITAQKNAGANTSGIIAIGTQTMVGGQCNMVEESKFRPTQSFFVDSSGDTIRPTITNPLVATKDCDYIWLDSESMQISPGQQARIKIFLTSKNRQVGAWAAEFAAYAYPGHTEPRFPSGRTVSMVSATRGPDNPSTWDFFVRGSEDPPTNMASVQSLGSGLDFFQGSDLEVATTIWNTDGCGTRDQIIFNPHWPGWSYQGTYLSTLQLHSIHLVNPEYDIPSWERTNPDETLYAHGTVIGTVPCKKPPCRGCVVTQDDLIQGQGKQDP